MKKFKRITVMLLVLVTLLAVFPYAVYAAADEGNPDPNANSYGISTCANMVCFDEGGNMYGRSNWGSFAAAQSYYGTGLSYYSCNVNYVGTHYNYYYTFSDNTRMYFGVK